MSSSYRRRVAYRSLVLWPAVMVRGLNRQPVTLIDVSRFGAKIKVSAALAVGENVTISCERFAIDGVVAWRKTNMAGLKFCKDDARLNAFLPKLPLEDPAPRFGRRGR